jgi:hypothetical protein
MTTAVSNALRRRLRRERIEMVSIGFLCRIMMLSAVDAAFDPLGSAALGIHAMLE